MATKLLPPAYYLGGKGRIAPSIVDVINPTETFVDLCCGSGGVFLEVVSRGRVPIGNVVAIDAGPWGDVWAAVGAGTFPIDTLARYAAVYDARTWHDCVLEISRERDLAAFILRQAATFGGIAVDWDGLAWSPPSGPRSSLRRFTGGNHLPSVPQPSGCLYRMRVIVERALGISAERMTITPEAMRSAPRGRTCYMDPPYRGTKGYGRDIDAEGTAHAVGGCWISEARQLSERAILLSSNRRALGGVTTRPREEWLSYVS